MSIPGRGAGIFHSEISLLYERLVKLFGGNKETTALKVTACHPTSQKAHSSSLHSPRPGNAPEVAPGTAEDLRNATPGPDAA